MNHKIEELPRPIKFIIKIAFIAVLMLGVNVAFAQEDCTDCPEGFTPGQGNINASYTYREFVSDGVDCTNIQCVTITLNGNQETNGFQTYSGIPVPVDGTIVNTNNTCCASLAPTVIPIDGTIIAYMDGSMDVEYWRSDLQNPEVQFLFVAGGTGTCETMQVQDITFGQGFQIIENGSASFSGGACEDDEGDPPDDPDEPDDPPGPDDPPNPTDDDDPPTWPDGPGGEPDEPTPPDPPDEPDTPGGDPDDPYPDEPTDDECCLAIVYRLDVINQWLQYNHGELQNINENLYNTRLETYEHMNALMYDDNSYLKTIVQHAQDIESYLRDTYELEYNQEYYLKKLYERFYQDEDQTDPDLPQDAEDYEFTAFDSSDSQALLQTHQTSMLEHNQDFYLPDIEPYMPQESTQAPVWDFDITRPVTNHSFPVHVDFEPMTPIRNAVHYAVIFLASFHGFNIVMGVLKK